MKRPLHEHLPGLSCIAVHLKALISSALQRLLLLLRTTVHMNSRSTTLSDKVYYRIGVSIVVGIKGSWSSCCTSNFEVETVESPEDEFHMEFKNTSKQREKL